MPSLNSLISDFRQAFRGLRREKAFTATVLATFALCLGANVAIFTVVHSVLLKPLPYSEPGRLVAVYNGYPKVGYDRSGCTIANYYEFKEQITAFEEVAVSRGPQPAIIGETGAPTRIQVRKASPSFFRTLGVRPMLGRAFAEEENEYGHSDVAVLSHSFWKAHFNSAPSVIGTTIRINSVPTTIIGVMPPSFGFLSDAVQLYQPQPSSAEDRLSKNRHRNCNYDITARLKPGVSIAEAQAQMEALNERMMKSDPQSKLIADSGFRTTVDGLQADHVKKARPSLLLLQAGALFLLLIGAVNLVNILVIRATARAKELAVRQVLGAGRFHLGCQIVSETLVLSLLGGALGLSLGSVSLSALSFIGLDKLPLGAHVQLDASVIVVSMVATLLTGLILSLPVVWLSLHRDLAPVLTSSSRGGTATRATHRLRHGLIVAQVALAFVLLTGAGLLGLSFHRVLSVQAGFRTENLITGQYALPWSVYKEDAKRYSFAQRLLEELKSIPGVQIAALSSCLPLSRKTNNDSLSIEGFKQASGQPHPNHLITYVAGDYFGAMGIRLLEGRQLSDADSASELRTCMIDAEVARRYWPNQSPLGRRLRRGLGENSPFPWFTIVGVVEPVKQRDLTEASPQGMIYMPYRAEVSPGESSLVVLTRQSPAYAGPAMRQAMLKADPGIPLDQLKTMTMIRDESLTDRRTPLMLAGFFALAALALASVGVYGVLAYAVAQREREIGVRMALGAQPGQVLAQFLFMGTRLLAAGLVLGLIGAWLTGRWLSGMLYGVSPTNTLVFVLTAAVLGSVVLLASLLPSRRAAHMDPMAALRSE